MRKQKYLMDKLGRKGSSSSSRGNVFIWHIFLRWTTTLLLLGESWTKHPDITHKIVYVFRLTDGATHSSASMSPVQSWWWGEKLPAWQRSTKRFLCVFFSQRDLFLFCFLLTSKTVFVMHKSRPFLKLKERKIKCKIKRYKKPFFTGKHCSIRLFSVGGSGSCSWLGSYQTIVT